MFIDPYQSLVSSISPLNRVIRSYIRTTYNLRIRDHSSMEGISILPHTNTYLHGCHLTNVLLIAYYILFIPQYSLKIVLPIFLIL